MGNAGIRLNTSSATLAAAIRPTSVVCACSSCAICVKSNRAPSTMMSTSAITRFTAGPASATTISCDGFSGMRSSEATPPIGSSVTSGVRMP